MRILSAYDRHRLIEFFLSSFFRFKPIFGSLFKSTPEKVSDLLITGTIPDNILDIKDAAVIEAGFEGALRIDTYTVAASAECTAEGGDDPQLSPVVRNLVTSGS